MRNQIITHVENTTEKGPRSGIASGHLVHKQQVSYCRVTPHLSAKDWWSPKGIEDLVLHTLQKRIGKVRYLAIFIDFIAGFMGFLMIFANFTGLYHIRQS